MDNIINISEYTSLLKQIKQRVQLAQKRAIFSASSELLHMYWDIGELLYKQQQAAGWGAKLLDRVSSDLKNEFPEIKGFSVRNCQFMIQFYKEYNQELTFTKPSVSQIGTSIAKQPVSHSQSNKYALPITQISWAHNVVIMQRVKDIEARYWYMHQTIKNAWSRDFLTEAIKLDYYGKHGALPYFIDLLFYHAFSHRYVVIELKRGEFKPEYIGKLNFYCSAIDDLLCREGDNQTIGLLLCQNKDKVKAEYALRDINKPIGISEYELGKALPAHFVSSLPTIEEI